MPTTSETGASGGKKITIEQFYVIEEQLKQKFENGEIDRDEFNDLYDRLKCLYKQSENDSDVNEPGVDGKGWVDIKQYSGDLIKVNKPDSAADALAKRIGGVTCKIC